MQTIHLRKINKSDNSIEAQDCQGVYWTAQVKGCKDDLRTHIQCIAIKGGDFFKTDGSRVHRYTPLNRYKDGIYRIATNKKSEMCLISDDDKTAKDYPNVHELFKPTIEKDNIVVDSRGLDSAFAKIIRAIPEDLALNHKFCEDLVSTGDNFEVTALPDEDHQGPVLLQNGRKMALLMPMMV